MCAEVSDIVYPEKEPSQLRKGKKKKDENEKTGVVRRGNKN